MMKRTNHIDDAVRVYVCKKCEYKFNTVEIDEDLYEKLGLHKTWFISGI